MYNDYVLSDWDEWVPECWARDGRNFALDIGRDEEESHIWTAALIIMFSYPDGTDIDGNRVEGMDFAIFMQKKFDTLEEAKEWADWADLNEYRVNW